MKRRTYLISAAAAVATTGCLGSPPDDDGSEGNTPTPTPTSTDSNDTTPTATPSSVTFGPTSVQPGYITRNTPDSIAVWDDAGQYLVMKATHEEGPVPERTEFSLQIGDEQIAPQDIRTLYRDGDYPPVYDQEESAGWLVFAVPEAVSADSATVTWPGGEWTVPADLVARLTEPPGTFDVSFEAPATVEAGETPTLTMEITNTADTAATFVFAMNRVGPRIAYTPVRGGGIEIEPGETVTRTWNGKTPEPEADTTYHLDPLHDDRMSRSIELAE